MIATGDGCGDSDDLFFDAKRHRVYLICGDGYLDVFEARRDAYRRSAHIPTISGARIALFVPELVPRDFCDHSSARPLLVPCLPIDNLKGLALFAPWGSDLPVRRHAQESRPVFRQGRSMPAISFCFARRVRRDWHASATACRHWIVAALMVTIGVFASPVSAITQSQTVDLSRQPIGSAPQDFEFWRAGEPDPNHWTIVREAATDNTVSIQQSGESRAAPPSLAIYKPRWAVNAKISARFKLIDGSMPSAGIAVRVISPNDYYLVRASASEQRLSLLHVVDGTSEEIADVDADVTPNHWQSLEVVVNGNSFKISLDGQWVLTGFDYSKPVNGQFGIWAERDDVTRFNQIEISPLTYASNRDDLRGRREEQDNDGVDE